MSALETTDSPLHRAMRRLGAWLGVLRPAEWVVVLFLLYMSGFDHTGMQAAPGMPLITLSAILTATAVRQVQQLRTRWALDPLRVYRRVAPPALVAIGLLGVWLALSWLNRPPGPTIGILSGALHSLDDFVGVVVLPTLPLVVAVLGVGNHLAANGEVAFGELVLGTLSEVWSTARAWAPPVIMVFMYGLMSAALGNIERPDQDGVLMAADRWLCLGNDPVQALQAIVSRPLSEWMAFVYMAYLPIYAVGLGAAFAFCPPARFRELTLAVTACLALGFVGYTLVPARGPMFSETFRVDLGGYYLQGIKEQIMDRFRAPRDCFPSLHTAIPLTFVAFCRRWLRPLFWGLIPVVAFIPLSCLYLRYHYLSDVLAGALLALLCTWGARAVAAIGESARNPAISARPFP